MYLMLANQTTVLLFNAAQHRIELKYLECDVPEIKVARAFVKCHNWLGSLLNYYFTGDVSRCWNNTKQHCENW